MIRTLLAASAVVALAGAAQAQGYDAYGYDAYGQDSGGVTVYGQPRDAYIIRLDTRGKDIATVRREISWAAQTACRNAPRLTNDVHETRPAAMSACVSRASWDANSQLARIQQQRRWNGGYIAVAANDYYDGGY
jgi:hypothetical protein